MGLRSGDLERALDVLQVVGDATSRDEFITLAVRGARELVPCMLASANEVDLPAGRFVFWNEPSDFPYPENGPRLLAELGHENPLIAHYEATGDGSALRFSDLVSQEELHRTRLYQELYGPIGVEYMMSMTLPAPRPKIFAVVFGDNERDFSEADRLIMNRIRPHLSQIWRRVRDQDRLRTMAEVSTELAPSGSGAVLLADRPEEVVPGSLVALYRHFGRPPMHSHFPARVERWLTAQRAELHRRDGLALHRPLSAHSDGSSVVLRYLPGGPARPEAILIEAPVARGPSDLEALGLTRREAEVAQLVMAGVPNKEIAVRLRVSAGTVRKHLDNIYAKLGVHSRTALTALVFDISGDA